MVAVVPIYRILELGGDDPDLALIGRKLALWEVSTAYPLIFRIAISDAESEVKVTLYRLVQSYLVRRAICGLTPKNLNKTFARITHALLENGVSVNAFNIAFEAQTGDAVRFPDDAELKQAILTKPMLRDCPSEGAPRRYSLGFRTRYEDEIQRCDTAT